MENKGGSSTELKHWDSDYFGNEIMTGVVGLRPIYSDFTLNLLKDSGWYDVNYLMA